MRHARRITSKPFSPLAKECHAMSLTSTRPVFCFAPLVLVVVFSVLLSAATPFADASQGPLWRIDSQASSWAKPESQLSFQVMVSNAGDKPTDPSQPAVLAMKLPTGWSVVNPSEVASEYPVNRTLFQESPFSITFCTGPGGS